MSHVRSGIPGPVLTIAIVNGVVGLVMTVLTVGVLIALPGPLFASLTEVDNVLQDSETATLTNSLRAMFSMLVPFAVAMSIAGVAAIIGAIGLARLRNWGRLITLSLAWLHIALAIVMLVTYFVMPAGSERVPPWDGLMSVGYPALVLSVLMSASIREAFQRARVPSGTCTSALPQPASV